MASDADALLAQFAVEQGYLKQAQVDEALSVQARAREALGIEHTLEQVLVSKKMLTSSRARELATAIAMKTGSAGLVAGYQVIQKLGQGGMGSVFKARKLDTDQIVALKVLLPGRTTPEYIKRFTRETQIASRLNHPNIVGCLGSGHDEEKGLYYCALDYVPGSDLSQYVDERGHMDEKGALLVALQVADALQHAFDHDLVHRDVKPENIVLSSSGAAMLLDLGLARPVAEEASRLTDSGVFVGSPYYASPEQSRSQADLDIRSDIYSLGATLYYLVTGHPPFEGESSLLVLQAHVYEKLQWPADINPNLSDSVCYLISKMMAKDPADRYQTPKTLIKDIHSVLRGEPLRFAEEFLKSTTIAPRGSMLGVRIDAENESTGEHAQRDEDYEADEDEDEPESTPPRGRVLLYLGLIGFVLAAAVAAYTIVQRRQRGTDAVIAPER